MVEVPHMVKFNILLEIVEVELLLKEMFLDLEKVEETIQPQHAIEIYQVV